MPSRQPIITVLGHVDHGKTTLLDTIRQTAIAEREPGQITQCIGASAIPKNIIEKICGPLLDRFKFKVNVPGLLFIDTPGHAAFESLRKRGGALADLAILVVDIAEGVMPQTKESLEILKQEKTPFVVAINKIDRIQGWRPTEGVSSFLENYANQSELTQSMFEQSFYKVVEQISRIGFASDRFDRVADFKTTIACVPVSGKSGEGIPELLAIIIGLSQAFLKEQLELTPEAQGTVLEVKETVGLGSTIDAILYDGQLKRGDWLVVGGRPPIVTKIKALLEPAPMRELRQERKFEQVQEASAACGIKIAAPGMEFAIAGSPIRAAPSKEEAEILAEQLEHELEEVEIVTEKEGLVLKADTIGALEALITIFKEYPIKEATLGPPLKETVLHTQANADPMRQVIIAFNVPISQEIEQLAKDRSVAILKSDIIYHLLEDYRKWIAEKQEEILRKQLEGVTRPAKLRLLQGYVFRQSDPAIVGCEITGFIRSGYKLMKPERGRIGEIRELQHEGKTIESAKSGERVAVSIQGPAVGRQIQEGDTLYTDLTPEEFKTLDSLRKLLTEAERSVLDEIAEIKRKEEPSYGM